VAVTSKEEKSAAKSSLPVLLKVESDKTEVARTKGVAINHKKMSAGFLNMRLLLISHV